MPCRVPSSSDTTWTRALTRACRPGAAQNAGERSRGLRDLPMRVGCGAVSSGAGWMPTPNPRSLWWTSRTRLIPGSSCGKRGHHTDSTRPSAPRAPSCANLGELHPLGRRDMPHTQPRPKISVATSGTCRSSNRGMAKPCQPGSSCPPKITAVRKNICKESVREATRSPAPGPARPAPRS